MKKIFKKSLFIIAFCLLLLFLNNSNVQAADVTTVQELQEIMGAEEYSTIEGTTLKITNDFTWEISGFVNLKIPELTIDFNGKKISLDYNTGLRTTEILEGKVILKDSMGTSGGICILDVNGSLGGCIPIYDGAELIIENGQYTCENDDNFSNMFYCNGGKITIKNGVFKGSILDIDGGTVEIEDGNFEGSESYPREIISVSGTDEMKLCSTLLVNGGKFTNNTDYVMTVSNTDQTFLNIRLSGRRNGEFIGQGLHLRI